MTGVVQKQWSFCHTLWIDAESWLAVQLAASVLSIAPTDRPAPLALLR